MNTPGGLGRIVIPDERDKSFLMAAPSTERTFRNWMVQGGVVLDQGQTSQCVAYAWDAYLMAHPIVNAHRKDLDVDPAEVYREAQKVDQWPGEEPVYEGTSVRAGAKVLASRGYINGYSWAWTVGPVVQHVLEIGPVVMGTTWYSGMSRPDAHGYIHPVGMIQGGHAWLVLGVNTKHKNPDGTVGRARMQNSWGPWGDKGRAWVSLDAVDTLIRGNGEACTAMEARVR